MNANILTATTATLVMSVSSAASATTIHVEGTVFGHNWGAWVSGLFLGEPTGSGATHYSYADGGSGNPMDFMMQLSDGVAVDGADVNMRMITADTVGNVGDAQIGLVDWSCWIGLQDVGSLHFIWNSADAPLALDNLGSSGKDGVRYAASGFDEQLLWTLERLDGTVETFSSTFSVFEIIFPPVPAPGAAALFGLAGLTTARRRRI